jgi:hypothetical protein
MNLIKHMEAVFIATLALAVSSTWLADTLPSAHAKAPVTASATAAVPVVVVSAKRMTAQEKLQAERADAAAAVSRI